MAASVLGPEFPRSALCAVTEMNEASSLAVAELCGTGLLSEVRQLPEPVYRFRHALIQEATYRGLLYSQCRALHARAAWGLEAASAERLEEVAAVLGHHFHLAGEAERAVHHLEVAARHAVAMFAVDEALTYARRALLAAKEGVGEHDMAICVGNLGEYLFWHGDLDEAQEKCEAALAMVERIGDPFRTSDCLCWLSLIFLRRPRCRGCAVFISTGSSDGNGCEVPHVRRCGQGRHGLGGMEGRSL